MLDISGDRLLWLDFIMVCMYASMAISPLYNCNVFKPRKKDHINYKDLYTGFSFRCFSVLATYKSYFVLHK